MNAKVINAAMARAISNNFEGYVDAEWIRATMTGIFSHACAHDSQNVYVKRAPLREEEIFISFFRGLGYTVKHHSSDYLSIAW